MAGSDDGIGVPERMPPGRVEAGGDEEDRHPVGLMIAENRRGRNAVDVVVVGERRERDPSIVVIAEENGRRRAKDLVAAEDGRGR